MVLSWMCALAATAGCSSGAATPGSGSAAGTGAAAVGGSAAASGSGSGTAPAPTAPAVDAAPAVAAAGACDALTGSKFGALMIELVISKMPPNPDAVAAVRKNAVASAASINAALVTACSQDAWSAAAVTCIAKAMTAADLDPCQQELTGAQTQKMGQALSVVMESLLPHDPAAGAPPAPADDGQAAGPDACDQYVVVVNKLSRCAKLPAQVKDTAQKSVGQIKTAVEMLKQAGIPEQTKQATYGACKQAATQLTEVAKSMGCAL
jgi:hypothetical protein